MISKATQRSISVVSRSSLFAISKVTSNGVRNAANINGKEVTAEMLKSLQLTNVDNQKISVGSLTGNGKSVVVFLRHLG